MATSTQYPSSITGSGALNRNTDILAGHVFNAGLEKPDVSPILTIKFPQYYLTSLSEKIAGVSVAQGSKEHSWYVLDRTRKSATASSIASGTTASAVITTDITYVAASGNYGYFVVGDTIKVLDSGENGVVTAVGESGGFQTITVARTSGGNWSVALLPTGAKIGHIGTAFAEGSAGSGGVRSYLPSASSNVMQIFRRGFKVTSDMMNQKTWIGDKTWYFQNEDIEQQEFLRDIEATLVFGTHFQSTALGGRNFTRGLVQYAETSGTNMGFSSSIGVQEADIAEFIRLSVVQNSSDNLIALCGSRFLLDVQRALADRYRTIPNSEKLAEIAGLNFQSYEILGKKIHFALYELFTDTAIVPTVTPSTTAKDWDNACLILDFGTVAGGERNVQVRYRTGETGDRKMVQKFITGMASPGLNVSNAYDGLQGELLAEMMTKVVLPNRLGIIAANS